MVLGKKGYFGKLAARHRLFFSEKSNESLNIPEK
jgi:hypothetical protein